MCDIFYRSFVSNMLEIISQISISIKAKTNTKTRLNCKTQIWDSNIIEINERIMCGNSLSATR